MSDRNSRLLFKVKDLLRELALMKGELESKDAAKKEESVEFLMRKGFDRDVAHYVSHLIAFRGQMTQLRKITGNKRQQETIGDLIAYISDEIDIMYADQQIEKEDHHVR